MKQVVAAVEMGDSMPLYQPAGFGRLEEPHANHRPAGRQRAEGQGKPKDPAKGQRGHADRIVRKEAAGVGGDMRLIDHRMLGVDDQFRLIGGAGGGEDDTVGVAPGIAVKRFSVALQICVGDQPATADVQRRGAGLPAVLVIQHQGLDLRQGPRLDLVQDADEVDVLEAGPQHQKFGAGALDDVRHFDRAVSCVDRHHHGAHPGAGQKQDQPGRNVGQPQGQPVAPPDAQSRQAAGDPPAGLD